MATTISTTFAIKANSNDSSKSPGPLSTSLATSITQSLAVDAVTQFTIADVRTTFDATNFAEDAPLGQILLDGSDYTASAHSVSSGSSAADHHGAWVYIKNTTATGNHLVAIGHTTDADAGDDSEAGGTGGADLEPIVAGDADTMADKNQRLFSLRAGEFCFFPYDYTGDLYCQATGASQSLEVWIFHRTQ